MVYFDDGPQEVTETSAVIQMDSAGKLQVYTQDSDLIGEHELYIQARLADHSKVKAPVIVLPFIFERCEISLVDEPWILSNLTLAAGYTASYILDVPLFEYTNRGINNVTCGYSWHNFSVDLSLIQGEPSIDLAAYINFNEAMRTLTFQPHSPSYDIIIVA